MIATTTRTSCLETHTRTDQLAKRVPANHGACEVTQNGDSVNEFADFFHRAGCVDESRSMVTKVANASVLLLCDAARQMPISSLSMTSTSLELPAVTLSARQVRLVELLLQGALAPLDGFMNVATANAVTQTHRLADGTPWFAPIELVLEAAPDAPRCELRNGEGRPIALLEVTEHVRVADGVRLAGRLRMPRAPMSLLRVQVDAFVAANNVAELVAYGYADCLHRFDLRYLEPALRGDGNRGVILLRIADQEDHPSLRAHTTRDANVASLSHLGTTPRLVVDLPRIPGAANAVRELFARVAANLGATRLIDARRDVAPAHASVVAALQRGDDAAIRSLTWPEVGALLRRAYPPPREQGFTVLLTGLSGAGKSTIARSLAEELMTRTTRPITLLDGDLVRLHLSRGLGFDRADRETNLMRIAFVAREINRHGGIVVCAPIAPYESTRQRIRHWIEDVGHYVEVHVATPLEVCEERDTKGLYAKARSGALKGFTGIDDPYEYPGSAEVRFDTSLLAVPQAVARICHALELRNLIGAA